MSELCFRMMNLDVSKRPSVNEMLKMKVLKVQLEKLRDIYLKKGYNDAAEDIKQILRE